MEKPRGLALLLVSIVDTRASSKVGREHDLHRRWTPHAYGTNEKKASSPGKKIPYPKVFPVAVPPRRPAKASLHGTLEDQHSRRLPRREPERSGQPTDLDSPHQRTASSQRRDNIG